METNQCCQLWYSKVYNSLKHLMHCIVQISAIFFLVLVGNTEKGGGQLTNAYSYVDLQPPVCNQGHSLNHKKRWGGGLKSRGFDEVLSKRGSFPHLLTPLWPSGTTPLSISMIRIYDLGEAADIAINSAFC